MDKITPETHLEFKAENVIDKSILNKLLFALSNGQNQSLFYESYEKLQKHIFEHNVASGKYNTKIKTSLSKCMR